MKRIGLLLLLACLLALVGCQKAPPPSTAVKIKRISGLTGATVGTKVEVAGWLNSVAGDDDLGYELSICETPGNYPRAKIDLKDGQKAPEINREVCVRGEILFREEINGSFLYRLKQGEVIDCY